MIQKVERSLFEATVCFVGKLDRLGRDPRHLVDTVHDLTARGIGFEMLTGHGASIDTTFPGGKLVFGIFAALAEFERELIIERTKAGMAAARARNGGRPYKMAPPASPVVSGKRNRRLASRISRIRVSMSRAGIERILGFLRRADCEGQLPGRPP